MKKLISLVICLVLAFSTMPMFATSANAATNYGYSFSISNGEATLDKCSTTEDGVFRIPAETPNGYPVTSIGNDAFKNCTLITHIVIPNSVKYIGVWAFDNCTGLKGITISDSVKTIDKYAFSGCSALKNVYYQGTESQKAKITMGSGNSLLTNATWHYNSCIGSASHTYVNSNDPRCHICDYIDESSPYKGVCGDDIIWYINTNTGVLTLSGTGKTYNYDNGNNKNPFTDNRSIIKSIVIGDGITHLGNRLFRGVTQATSVKFGKDVATMGYEVFYADNKLSSVQLNEGLTMLGALTFYNCTGLKQISIPSTVTNLQNRAFKGSGLTSIVVPDTVKTTGYEVFMNCASLSSVSFSKGVTMLNPRTFENCTSLKTFNFTRNMCRIRSRAFYGCTALESITFEDADNMWGSSNGSEAKIASNSFDGCKSTLQLIAKDNSHVESYASRRGFTFVAK